MAQDNTYEFNAPRYIDFTQGIPDVVDDSSYFELVLAKEKAKKDPQPATDTAAEDTQMDTEETDTKPQQDTDKTLTGTAETDMEVKQTDTDQPQEPHHEEEPQEVEEEEEEGATATASATHSATASPRVSVRSKVKKMRRRSQSVGVRQSPRLLAISKALRRSAAQRSPGTPQSSGSSSRVRGSIVAKVKPQKKVNTRVPGVASLTQDDKTELDTVATFRHKIHENRQKDTHTKQPLKPTKVHEFHFATDQRLRNQADAAPSMPAPAPRPTRTGPTKPQEFTFATDSRLKGKDGVKGEEVEKVDFVRMLRSSSTSSLSKDSTATGKRGCTIPQPFNLSDTRRQQQQGEGAHKFVSLAELNLKYLIGTPERFRTKRAGSVELQEASNNNTKKLKGPTMPHTPNLATGRRRRSLSVMTQEEREQQEFEEAQKHAFKARPVNKKVFGSPKTGYHVEKKLLTVPEPFNITDSKKVVKLPESLSSFVAALPYGGIDSRPTRSKTRVQPFSFDERDKAKLEEKQKKIQKLLEEEKRAAEFHARPMPVFEDGVHGVPPKRPPTPTQVKPFTMRVDQRGMHYQEKIKHNLEKEAQFEAEQRQFRAQSDDVVHRMPFVPEKSKKPLTEISNVTLNTEIRASERSEYELQQKAVEEERLAAKKREEERRAAEELAEVARLRQEAVHKAQPVPKFKPMVIQPSQQLPTVPRSPDFATNTRLRSRSASRTNSTFSVDM